jgi:lipid-A-disaccharide synthase
VKILISAAETSSDAHGAALLEALRRLARAEGVEVDAFGIGGPKLEAQGLRSLVDARGLLSMGFLEIVGRLPRILGALRTVARAAERERPAAAVVIDYPDFHFRLAKKLKAAGIPVVYYIPPKVWVWRKSRVKVLRERFARLLCIFPFEEEFYRREGVPVKYVGNPLLDQLPLALTREEARARLGIGASRRALLLMAGSRPGELKHHLELLLDSAHFASRKLVEIGALAEGERLLVLLPCAHTSDLADFEARVASWREGAEGVWSSKPGRLPLELRVSRGDAHECMVAADAAISKSGTSTLEAALLGCVQAVVYRSNWISHFIFRHLIRYPGPVGLVNLVADRSNGKPYLARELLGAAMTREAVASEIISLLTDEPRRAEIRAGLVELKRRMVGGGGLRPSESAAREVLEIARGCAR